MIGVNIVAVKKQATYHHGRLREDLIDQAEELIAESGAQAWSMREAARRLGVSQAAPYRHFTDKDALVDAVVKRGYGQLAEGYGRALARCRTEGDRLVAVTMAYYQYGVSKPELFTLMFSSPRLHSTTEASESYAVFENEVSAAQARGDLPVGSVRAQAHALWGTAHGIAELVNHGVFGPRHGKRVAELAIASAVDGLRATSPSRTDG